MSRNYSRKKVRKTIQVNEEDHANFEKLAKITKLDMGIVAGYLADLSLKYDLFSVGWEDRMKANLSSVEGLEYLTAENECESLSWDETNWLCVERRKGKAPMVKKLGKTIQLMNGRCTPCKAQRWAKEDIEFAENCSADIGYRRGSLNEFTLRARKRDLYKRGTVEEMNLQVEEELTFWRKWRKGDPLPI